MAFFHYIDKIIPQELYESGRKRDKGQLHGQYIKSDIVFFNKGISQCKRNNFIAFFQLRLPLSLASPFQEKYFEENNT